MPTALGEELRHQTVLVTGGAGFIGCALAARIAPGSGRYVVVDNLHPQVHARRERPDGLHSAAELVVADVTDAATWDALLETTRPDVVIHLAAETGTGQSLTEATRHALVNVVGTTAMFEGSYARAIGRLAPCSPSAARSTVFDRAQSVRSSSAPQNG